MISCRFVDNRFIIKELTILLIPSIERRVCSLWFVLRIEFLMVLIVPCTCHHCGNLGFRMDILPIGSIEKRECSLWFKSNSWWCSLFLVHAIIISCYDLEWTCSWSKASNEEFISFDSNFFLMVLIVSFTCHYRLLLLGFGMDILLIPCIERRVWIRVHAIIVSSTNSDWASSLSNASKEKYVHFDTNKVSDGSCYSLYMPSSSPPRIRNWYPPDSKYQKKRIDPKHRSI